MQARETESVYQRVLGPRFSELDPRLRSYFELTPVGTIGVGRGVYDIAGSRVRALRPLLSLMATRQTLFPELGRDVPFTVVNTNHADGTLSAVRTFAFPQRTRVMCDTMTVIDGRLIDRLGTRGGLDVALDVFVDGGGVHLASRRLAVRLLGARIPLPSLAHVSVFERADGDGQRVDVRIRSPLIGEWFRYSGRFTYEHERVREEGAQRRMSRMS
ncbi:MAG: DUF4166 domain-containing protein [Microbacterium sp.]